MCVIVIQINMIQIKHYFFNQTNLSLLFLLTILDLIANAI